VISFSDICPIKDEKSFWDCDLMDSYCFYLKSGLKDKAEELVGTVFNELKAKTSSRETVRVLSCNFIANALNVLLELGIKQLQVFKDGIQPFESIFKLNSLSETENHIKGISAGVALAAGKQHGKKTRKLINDVKEYINCSFSNPDLTLSEVARRFYINPSYLSRVFKEEIGITFIDYLTKQRMEKSIRLFHETDKKAYQIAAEVGVNDPHYFSVCFKKYTGVSVNDFKKGKI
jgi:two-component system response regulator YesN